MLFIAKVEISFRDVCRLTRIFTEKIWEAVLRRISSGAKDKFSAQMIEEDVTIGKLENTVLFICL